MYVCRFNIHWHLILHILRLQPNKWKRYYLGQEGIISNRLGKSLRLEAYCITTATGRKLVLFQIICSREGGYKLINFSTNQQFLKGKVVVLFLYLVPHIQRVQAIQCVWYLVFGICILSIWCQIPEVSRIIRWWLYWGHPQYGSHNTTFCPFITSHPMMILHFFSPCDGEKIWVCVIANMALQLGLNKFLDGNKCKW